MNCRNAEPYSAKAIRLEFNQLLNHLCIVKARKGILIPGECRLPRMGVILIIRTEVAVIDYLIDNLASVATESLFSYGELSILTGLAAVVAGSGNLNGLLLHYLTTSVQIAQSMWLTTSSAMEPLARCAMPRRPWVRIVMISALTSLEKFLIPSSSVMSLKMFTV